MTSRWPYFLAAASAVGIGAFVAWLSTEAGSSRFPPAPGEAGVEDPFAVLDTEQLDPASPGAGEGESGSLGSAAGEEARYLTLLEDFPALGARVAARVEEGAPPSARLLAEVYVSSEEVELRAAVLQALERLGDGPAARALAEFAEADPSARDQAATRLSRFRDRVAAPALRAILDESLARGIDGVPLAAAALRALGRTRLREHLERFTGLAGDPAAARPVRLAAIEAIAKVADPAALPTLASLLSGEDARLRRATLRALGRIHHPDALRLLEGFLPNAAGAHEREIAEESIALQRGEARIGP